MSDTETPQEGSTADENVERLISQAYRPELPDAKFTQALTEELCAAARQRAEKRALAEPVAPRRIGRWIEWGLAAAAGIAVMLAIDAYRRLQSVEQPPQQAHVQPAQNSPARPDGPALAESGDDGVGMTPRARAEAPTTQPLLAGQTIQTAAGDKRRVPLADGSVLYVNEKTAVRVDGERQVTVSGGEVFIEVAPRRGGAGGSGGSPETFIVKTPGRQVTALGTKFDVQVDNGGTGVLVTQGKVAVSGVQSQVLAGQQLGADATAPVSAPRASHALGWAQDLIAEAETPLVPDSDYRGGALVVVDPNGQESRLELRKYQVDAYIEDGFVRTTIDQTYFNYENRRMEGTFYFPMPPDASLSRLAMYVDGNLMEGGMADRQYAATVYNSIVSRQKDPALLEWVDGSTFKMRVFPLEGRQEKRIVISYTQKLGALYGRSDWRFPGGHSLGLVRDWAFHARIKGGTTMQWACDSHALAASVDGADLLLDASSKIVKPDKDIVLRLHDTSATAMASDVARFSTVSQDGYRYLMLRYRPSLPAQPVRERRDWAFLFESSADRDPLLARAQIEVIRGILENAEHDDTFAIVTAGTHATKVIAQPVAATVENIKIALANLEKTHLIGALDLGQGLDAAGELLKGSKNPYLVHVGGGVATIGERKADVLATRLPDGVRYIGVGVGKHWSRALMKTAAERSGGYFTQINPDEQVRWRAFDLVSTLNTPRLLGVKVIDPAEKMTFLSYSDSLAQGEELCAIARLSGTDGLPPNLTITGTLNGQPFKREVAVQQPADGAGYLPRTWAKLEIDRLVAAGAEANKEKIVELSKASYVMSPFTSLLVLENEAMYQQFHIDRGRKDHWAMYPCPEKIPVVYEPDANSGVRPANAPPTTTAPAKPSAEQVMGTILVRIPPQLLTPSPYSNYGGRFLTAWQLYTGAYALPDYTSWYGLDDMEGLERVGLVSGDRIITLRDLRGRMLGRNVLEDGRRSDLPLAWGRTQQGKGIKFVIDRSGRLEKREFDALRRDLDRDINGRFGGWRVGDNWQMPAGGDYGDATFYLLRAPHDASNISRFLTMPPSDITATSVNGLYSGYTIVNGGTLTLSGTSTFTGVTNFSANTLYITNGDLLTIGSLSGTGLTTLDGSDYWHRRGQSPLAIDLRGYYGAFNPNQRAPLSYNRPGFTGDYRVFSDLTAWAPGLNTSDADILAVVDAEAAPAKESIWGTVQSGARELIEAARSAGWQKIAIPASTWRPGFTVTFDGAGRFVVDRVLPSGLREQTVCDGSTLLQLYPDIGLGAKRPMSRFHRAQLSALVPWSLPPADDLADGADVRLTDAHTITLVPRGAETAKDKEGKPAEYVVVRMVFDGKRLSEKQWVKMPTGKVLLRQTFDAAGVVRLIDGEDKELNKTDLAVSPGAAPGLSPDTKQLVVLPMPIRSRDGLVQKYPELQNKSVAECGEEAALAQIAAQLAEGSALNSPIAARFFARDDRRVGFYTLLAASGQNWEPATVQYNSGNGKTVYFNPIGDCGGTPLAQYIAQQNDLARGVYNEVKPIDGPADGFLQQLVTFRGLWADNSSGRVNQNDARLAWQRRGIDFVRACRDPYMGWAAMSLLMNYGGSQEQNRSLAAVLKTYETAPGLKFYARYEQARTLQNAADTDQAIRLLADLYEDAVKDGALLPIDYTFGNMFHANEQTANQLRRMLRKAHAAVSAKFGRQAGVYVAWQCQQANEPALAEELLVASFTGMKDEERFGVTMAAVDFLASTSQWARADELLRPMLENEKYAKFEGLWRLSAYLAAQRGLTARAIDCQERAMDLEWKDLPDLVNVQALRQEYTSLLAGYEQVAKATQTLGMETPRKFVARVVRAADRWRSLDPDPTAPCQYAARILQTLGESDLAWDYITTPLAANPNEAVPWTNLAAALRQDGQYDLADRAFETAFEIEPTNAQLLWDRAQALQQRGRLNDAGRVFAKLATGQWEPRFDWIKSQAKQYATPTTSTTKP